MNKKFGFLILILLILIRTNSHSQQNTILIIADDVSPDYFGCFSSTTDTAITPNIRSLADRGIKFTKVWAAPVCSPTRAGILTGRYPFRTGVGQVITNASSPQLDTSEISIAELLRNVSPVPYNTACVGKWHLHANIISQRLYPNQMGFNFYSGNFNGAINNYYDYSTVKNGIVDSVNIYATTQTINDAIGWLDTVNSSNPFFLWVAFNAPHTPFHIPPAGLCNTSGLTGTTQDINASPEKYFKAAIQAMDTEIGRLLQYLVANNLSDSTNIIFIGDNGNSSQVAQINNQNKSKATLYDYGVRVPMIVAGPAVIDSNRTSDALINTPDLFGTIAELSGFNNWVTAIPQGTVVDSRSFLSIIKNQVGIERDWIFTEQFNSPAIMQDGKTIRNEDYHLIHKSDGNEEFYNLINDPEEDYNLLNGTLSGIDISNYILLCDTLTDLIGLGNCLPLGEDENLQRSFKLYPNPTGSSFSIESSEEIEQITLTSVDGFRAYQYWQNKVDVSELPSGLYFAEIKLLHRKPFYHKVIIQK